MKISIPIAEKLLLLINKKNLPSSSIKHQIIDDLIAENIVAKTGRINKTILLQNAEALICFLQNHFQINNLELYIATLKNEATNKADLVAIATNSKAKTIRSFKGFLVNCYSPIKAILNDEEIIISPTSGTFNFIYDYENFVPEKNVIIVGIENPTNFRHIEMQQYLFKNIEPLFVSRYPQNQSKDLVKWLQKIPNNYLYFGDFDIAGIGIYINEFKKHLGNKATLFIPQNIDEMIAQYGNKKRYNEQKINFDINAIEEENILQLIQSIHHCKKGLDQEIFIKHTHSSHHHNSYS